MKYKRGMSGVIILFLIVMFLLFSVFGIALFMAVGDNFLNVITPTAQTLGVMNLPGGDTNLSEITTTPLTPLKQISDSSRYVVGGAYVFALIMVIAISVTYRYNKSKVFIVLFFFLILLAYMLSVVMSNSYQDLYEGNDFVGDELRQNTLISYLLLNSPLVTLIVMMIGAVVMFTGRPEEFI